MIKTQHELPVLILISYISVNYYKSLDLIFLAYERMDKIRCRQSENNSLHSANQRKHSNIKYLYYRLSLTWLPLSCLSYIEMYSKELSFLLIHILSSLIGMNKSDI